MKFLIIGVVILADVVYNPPGWLPCKDIEGTWQWWLQGCFMSSTAASSFMGWALPAALVGVMSMSLRQPRVK